MRVAIGYRPLFSFLALVAVAITVACGSGRESARSLGFYAEVAIEVEPHPGDPLARFESGQGRSVIRWWYAPDPARWRWEIETFDTVIDDGVLLVVADGTDSWEYDVRTNVYRRGVFAGFPDEVAVSPGFSAPVGPAHAPTVDALMAQWRERGVAPEVALAGEATLLGRRAQVVELRTPGGVTRVLVDPERMFIMRWAVDATDGAQSYHAEVTALDYGTEIDDAKFTFEPPPGAREADAEATGSCSGSGTAGGASFPAEPGFLAPAYTPPGYRTAGTGGESDAYGCDPVAVWVLLEAADDAQILLRQRFRPGGMPTLDRSWQSVASGLDDAYSRRSGNGLLNLLWRTGDIVALLQADDVSLEELLRIAESASLAPGRSR